MSDPDIYRRLERIEKILEQFVSNEVDAGSSGYPALSGLTTGQPLRATGATAAAFGPLDLANADAITGDLPDANLSANVPLLNAQNEFTASQGIGAAASSTYELYVYRLTTSVSVIDAALTAELDATNNADTSYQSAGLIATNRYRGATSATSGSANKGQMGLVMNCFNSNTGTTLLVGGARLDVRNTSTGTVTEMIGNLINQMLNSGGGTVTTAIGLKLEQQTVGGTNWQIKSDGGNNQWGAGFHEMTEMTAPSAGAANTGRLFLRDNGAGKTQLCIIFNTGAVQVIATQP